jgi:hypothetical protein
LGWEDLGEQKLYTDEELKKFEEEYAKNQGWGDHAYDPLAAQPPPNVHQPPPNQVPPAGQVHPNQVPPVGQAHQVSFLG